MKNPDGTLCSEPDNAESFPDWASIGGISIKGSCRAFSRAGRNPGASRAGRTGLRTQAGPSRLISGGGRRTRREVSSKWGKTKKRESRHFPGAPGGTIRRRESRGTSGLLRDAARDARDRPEPRVVERGGRWRNLGPPRTMPLQSARTWETPRGAYSTTDPAGRRRERERAVVVRLDGVDVGASALNPAEGERGSPPCTPPSPSGACGEGCVRALLRGAAPRRGVQGFFFVQGHRSGSMRPVCPRFAGRESRPRVRLMDDLAATMSEEVSRTPSRTK